MILKIPVDTCCVCDSSHHKLLSYGYDYEYETSDDKWFFVKCLECGHIWLNPRPDTSCLDLIYPNNYYSYDMDKKLSPIIYRGKRYLDQQKIARILSMATTKISSYLDIGCGDGRYLDIMTNKYRIKSTGTEIDPLSVIALKGKGLRCIHASTSTDLSTKLQKGQYNLISMFHVIEHFDNPLEYIRAVNLLLEDNGILVLETPNYDSVDFKIFRNKYWGGYHFPRHFHIFKSSTIKLLLTKAGFTIIREEYCPGHSFWLFSLHHFFKYSVKSRLLANIFHPMKSKLFLVIFTIFDTIRAVLGFKTSSIMIIAQKSTH